jgi:calpain-15
MSAACPIELLDEDPAQHLSDEGTVRLFLEVTGTQNRATAIKTLQESDYDLQRAISAIFQDQIHATGAAPESKPNGELPKTIETDPSGPKHKLATKPQQLLALSPEWHARMSSSPGLFVDPDFPPNQSSLDGRKQTSEQKSVVHCPCGLAASARAVQSEGPNYGRFYLGCGKKTGRGPKVQQCKFFQWEDRHGSQGAGYATRYSIMAWEYFGSPHCCMVSTEISPKAVRQGSIGNCWFLSALAVVAEKPYLIRQVLPHCELNAKGCYQVNLCLDGRWTPVIVDSNLPVVHGDPAKDQTFRGGIPSSVSNSLIAVPAFCAIPGGQLWPALIEKAYAKAHGSYVQLSGGFIQEAFYDMTGAPTETVIFGACWEVEELWARLLSFSEAGFIMGVATNKGGDGLVGHHAYSVLQVLEIHDAVVGEQQRVTDFFTGSPEKKKETKKQKTTLRLVRIRNPWGKKEWKGDFSDSSDKWTTAMRRRLGDGTFWMSYEDMMERFHHMDVAKCREVSFEVFFHQNST